MATQAMSSSAMPINHAQGDDVPPAPDTSVSVAGAPQYAAHPEAEEIVRQVDIYFSEDNLRHDAHLLGLLKEGSGTVSISNILGFRKMRRFKPMTAVREALRQSTVVEVCDGKRLRRREPLKKPITVIPAIQGRPEKKAVLEDKPWLTKAMLKPTGFEPYVADGPIKPDEYSKDRDEYDPDITFTQRIETAILRFCNRRTMHQQTRAIFDKWMIFGGIATNQRQFTGGLDEKSTEAYTKKEIAQMTMNYGVSEQAYDGLDDDDGDGQSTWDVDFEAVAKAFLSTEFRALFGGSNEGVMTVTNVMRNFYNYLLLHDVCPEYKAQILAARKVCDAAEDELLKLTRLQPGMPGDFNIACSTIHGGSWADLHGSGGDWVNQDDNKGLSKEDARLIFQAGVFAHGTEEQLARMEEVMAEGKSFAVVGEQNIGLEVIKICPPNLDAKSVYEDARLSSPAIRPVGQIRCKRWQPPHTPPRDLPTWAIDIERDEELEILIPEAMLQDFFLGLKMEVVVKELDLGVKFIDFFEASYPSFFTWLENGRIRGWEEPGPPKAWMKTQMQKMGHSYEGSEVTVRELSEDEGSEPD